MAATASESFQQLLTKLYDSQPHFCLTETPFSAQILIRKMHQQVETVTLSKASISKNDESI